MYPCFIAVIANVSNESDKLNAMNHLKIRPWQKCEMKDSYDLVDFLVEKISITNRNPLNITMPSIILNRDASEKRSMRDILIIIIIQWTWLFPLYGQKFNYFIAWNMFIVFNVNHTSILVWGFFFRIAK